MSTRVRDDLVPRSHVAHPPCPALCGDVHRRVAPDLLVRADMDPAPRVHLRSLPAPLCRDSRRTPRRASGLLVPATDADTRDDDAAPRLRLRALLLLASGDVFRTPVRSVSDRAEDDAVPRLRPRELIPPRSGDPAHEVWRRTREVRSGVACHVRDELVPRGWHTGLRKGFHSVLGRADRARDLKTVNHWPDPRPNVRRESFTLPGPWGPLNTFTS